MASSSKGKEKVQAQPYKAAFNKSPAEVRKEALKAVPEEKKLHPDAYKWAIKTEHPKEFIYPYIPLTIKWITPVELKYANLTPQETAAFYLKDFADPYLHPKDYIFYYKILAATGSVDIESVNRTGGEAAYSKFFIKKIIFPDQWEGDLYRMKEIQFYKNDKIMINYFDYIKAWEGALCYDNRQRKHSWFIQFRDCKYFTFPQWFINWFYTWGLNQITLPQDVRNIFNTFKEVNTSMKYHTLIFAAYYQVPWIVRWEPTIDNRIVERFIEDAKTSTMVPYLGRQILIKWWDKFDFFATEAIFAKNGILNKEPVRIPPPPPPKQDLGSVLKELLTSSSKSELRKLFQEVLAESDKESDTEGTDSCKVKDSEDTEMQDSQDPYA